MRRSGATTAGKSGIMISMTIRKELLMDEALIHWETDATVAQERAQRERKYLLLDFSREH